jgi:hypothetical protein
VAHNVRYDVKAWRSGDIPDSDADADTVFRERIGVCAGYSTLMEALGRAAGLDVRYVAGETEMGRHAWNAIDVDGREYTIDATWDAGTVDKDGFHRRYSTRWFLVPMGADSRVPMRELVTASIRELEPQLDAIWALEETPAARRAHIVALWEQAAEPDDPDLGWAGTRARLVIDAWIHKHLPEGSPDAFTAWEIRRANILRNWPRFDPYP